MAKKRKKPKLAAFRKAAKDRYEDVHGDDIMFEPNAKVEEVDPGVSAWVQTWVWVVLR